MCGTKLKQSREDFIALNVYIRKKENFQINNLHLTFYEVNIILIQNPGKDNTKKIKRKLQPIISHKYRYKNS